MSPSYRPIDCAFHDELLARATLRRVCTLRYREAASEEEREVEGVIEDVFSRGQEEFLRLRGGLTLRLDQLLSVDGIPLTQSCG